MGKKTQFDDDPRLPAAVELLGRSGSQEFQLRYDEEQEPIVWVAVVKYKGDAWECAGGRTPVEAAMRLAEQVFEQSVCAHCKRPAAVSSDWRDESPFANIVCWYVFDPELKKFRRSCEGDTLHEEGACHHYS